MKTRLLLKILLVYLIFTLASFSFLAAAGESLFRNSSRRSAAGELRSDAVSIANRQSDYYVDNGHLDTADLDNSAINCRILVLSTSNRVIYDSEKQLVGMQIPGFVPGMRSDDYQAGDFYGIFADLTISVSTPISVENNLQGYLTLHQNAARADARASVFMREAFIIYDIILLFSLVTLLVINIWVLKPIKAITAAAGEYAAGNLEYRIKVRSKDEIGYLADSLNEMATQLQNMDETQKQFISNVSHDFRSPLTSIKGYIQAMVDGVIPPETQEKYMHIIIGETERLTNLTQSMLSLNSLNEGSKSLDYTNFDMVALVRSVCDTFEGVCSEKDINFELITTAPPIFVRADQGRINQVLHNLIDNAIKFSPNHSPIRILVQDLGKKAFISVKDFGCGIPKDDLNKIWNRFYKSDASRGKNKKGTGLGLAITKEIINAHGESIDVTSTPGSGTEFIFRLPLAT